MPAVQGSATEPVPVQCVAQRGPGTFPLRMRYWFRSLLSMFGSPPMFSFRSKIAHGRVPVVPQVSIARLLPLDARYWVRSCEPTFGTPVWPGKFASHLFP